jgi:hypothetical protein
MFRTSKPLPLGGRTIKLKTLKFMRSGNRKGKVIYDQRYLTGSQKSGLFQYKYSKYRALEFPRLKGQEVKPMIKEGSIIGERRVFTREFKERAVELALNTNRKRACPRPRPKPEYAGLRETNELPKKAIAVFAIGNPGGGASVHAPASRPAPGYEDGETIGGTPKRVPCAAL